MFLPYSTDAPVYHWPYATVWIIAVNVAFWVLTSAEEMVAPGSIWILSYGDGLHPAQWFGSRFAHAGFFHLLGNMMFLWAFGLVVEGKIGGAAFLPIYLLIGVGQAAIEQLCMLGYTGYVPGSLGASAAIYGIMAMAIVWAPDNEVSFFWWIIYVGRGEATVFMFGGAFVMIDLGLALLLGGYAASSVLHVMGAAIGFPIGVLLLKRGVVDCEGWDLFSRYGDLKKQRLKKEAEAKAAAEREAAESAASAEHELTTLAAAQRQFDEYLAGGAGLAAHKLFTKLRHAGDGWRLDTARMAALVKALAVEKRYAEMAPHLADLIEADPEHADARRLTLAQLCVTKLDRPGRALELLGEIDPGRLDDKHRQLAAAVRRKAEALQSEGIVEFDDGEW